MGKKDLTWGRKRYCLKQHVNYDERDSLIFSSNKQKRKKKNRYKDDNNISRNGTIAIGRET